ncbi:MAG: bifunctional phosphoribosylaminoimidazolecarboxamide formyltransferase/IMP cyclohydrolase [Chloroflexota bacterium]|nr:bifunctional phosphoribosylaminoimidazolecarboxamide formyltransferase/IMP cyclohydrolase [Chloroflexota bacterium]
MRAVISVYDKTGIVDFARQLVELGVEIVSSGGTAAELRGAGVPVIEVSEVTNFPEMLDGRVKTLHPAIHAGILARRDDPEHMRTIAEHGIKPVDLVVSNLYPFQADPSIEMIDVGGPSLIRAAAKNHAFVTVLVDPDDYEPVVAELRMYREVTEPTRRRLAEAAFALTASYDARIAAWFNRNNQKLFPKRLTLPLERALDLRYGENPHQQAAFYRLELDAGRADSRPDGGDRPKYPTLGTLRQIHGPELGFNNLLDMDGAVNAVSAFAEPTIAIIKHTNPCGLASRPELAEAYRQALAGDSISAYGGILGSNRPIDLATAEAMGKSFVEVVVAPGYEPDALERLRKRAKTRLVELPGDWSVQPGAYTDLDLRRVRGGLLVQTLDFDSPNLGFEVVSQRPPTAEEREDLIFAWKVIRHVKSNAIVLVRDRALLGVGAGQMSRVESVDIAVRKAGDRAAGSVLASDAYFPFADGVEVAVRAGVRAIIQPGGSIRDKETIAAADAAGAAMVFTGERHFRH